MSQKPTAPAVLAALLLVWFCPSARAIDPPPDASASPEVLARQLLQVTGSADLGKQVMAQVLDTFRRAHPRIPDDFWAEFMASVDPHDIEEMVIPIYVSNLSTEELKAAIDFYTSPLGQSLVKKLPAITQQSMAAGQEWGEKLAADVVKRITKFKQLHPDA